MPMFSRELRNIAKSKGMQDVCQTRIAEETGDGMRGEKNMIRAVNMPRITYPS